MEYTGKVLVTQGPTRVTSERLIVYLEQGTSTARRIDALQDVEVRDRGRVGKGDRLEVDLRLGVSAHRAEDHPRRAVAEEHTGDQRVVRAFAASQRIRQSPIAASLSYEERSS